MTEAKTNAALVRIAAIENELSVLKRKLGGQPAKRRRVTLQGVWKDVSISDQEIEAAKKSWETHLDDIV